LTLADHVASVANDSGKGAQQASNFGDVLHKVADHAAPGIGDGIGLGARVAIPKVAYDITNELSPRIARDLGNHYDERTGYKLDGNSQDRRRLRAR